MANKGPQRPLVATDSTARPGRYPLGSALSRAAARALLERRFVERKRIDVVSSIPRPAGEGGIRIGPWIECEDGSLFRFSSLPPGMTTEESERIGSRQNWKPSTREWESQL